MNLFVLLKVSRFILREAFEGLQDWRQGFYSVFLQLVQWPCGHSMDEFGFLKLTIACVSP